MVTSSVRKFYLSRRLLLIVRTFLWGEAVETFLWSAENSDQGSFFTADAFPASCSNQKISVLIPFWSLSSFRNANDRWIHEYHRFARRVQLLQRNGPTGSVLLVLRGFAFAVKKGTTMKVLTWCSQKREVQLRPLTTMPEVKVIIFIDSQSPCLSHYVQVYFNS